LSVISDAVEKKYHINSFVFKHEQTWEKFAETVADKTVWIYGLGAGFRHLFRAEKFSENWNVVDNNPSYVGLLLGEMCELTVGSLAQYIPIKTKEELYANEPEKTVILVTNVKGYESIFDELQSNGFKCLFSLLLMEIALTDRKETVNTISHLSSEDLRKHYFQVWERTPIIKNKIVFSIGAYGGHAISITRSLLKKRKDLDIVWLVKNKTTALPEGVRAVLEGSWLAMYEMKTAAIWVYDVMVPWYMEKRKEQKYIQVKHWSSITLKKFYLDDEDTCPAGIARDEIFKNAQMMDVIFSGSTIDEESCKRGFGVGNIFERVGSPRSDILFEKDVAQRVYEYYGISAKKKCIMYAPTFRSEQLFRGGTVEINFDVERLLESCKRKFGGDWVFLLRLHPIIATNAIGLKQSENLVMVSDYQDSQELVCASEIVITDYSSLMFEPMYIGRKVFLYAPDRENYVDVERELLVPYEELPFSIAETEKELLQNIGDWEKVDYDEALRLFMAKYGLSEDGKASQRAADYLINVLKEM